VARKQDDGALRQHAQKGVCATYQVATYSERGCSLVTSNPVAETVENARKRQELAEMSPMRRLSPAGYQRRHGEKEDVPTGEALGARWRNPAERATAITVSGKCRSRHQGDGSGHITVYCGWACSKTHPEGRARTGEYSARQGEAGVR
jgi:hypothetical protein